MNDIEIIYETKNGKLSDHPIAFRNETQLIIKKEKQDYSSTTKFKAKSGPFLNEEQLKIKQEKIDIDLEFLATTSNSNNPDPIPLLTEQQLKVKKEKTETDLEIEAVILTNQNPDPTPLLNEQQLKIKEENARRRECLEKLENVTKHLSKKLKADFGGLSRPRVNNLKPVPKKEVQSLIMKKSNKIRRELLPGFKSFIKKEERLVQNLERLAKILEEASDENSLNFDQFLKEFQSVWSTLTNDMENCSDETQQQPSKRPKTANGHELSFSNVDELDHDDSIESIKDQYLPLLKRELAVYNKRVKKSKEYLKEITTANKFKTDVWKQYNNILASEKFIMLKLRKNKDDEDEDGYHNIYLTGQVAMH